MNRVLTEWNCATHSSAMASALACCGAGRWAELLVDGRPYSSPQAVYEAANRFWSQMNEPEWLEAFACHPRIGERSGDSASQHGRWSRQEQQSTSSASLATLDTIAAGNAEYEQKYGFTYIVCATGKSAEEMLAILLRRLESDRDAELKEAAEQQRQILQIRLRKWLEA